MPRKQRVKGGERTPVRGGRGKEGKREKVIGGGRGVKKKSKKKKSKRKRKREREKEGKTGT